MKFLIAIIKTSLIILFINSILLLNVNAESYDPTNDLFFAFGSRCKGKGPINSAALNDGASIKYIIENIRDDSSCKGISGILSDIDNLNIQQLLKERTANNDLEFMSFKANDLELAIKSESQMGSPDLDYIKALKQELLSVKVDIIKSQKLSRQELTKRRLETINNFQKYSNALFARLNQSDQCLTKNPNLSAQIGSQILGLGSSLASGVVGSLMLATGNLIDNFVSFLREKSLGSKMKIITNNRIGEALGCAFEGLGYTYCQARDIDTIINFNKNKSENNVLQSTWLDGIGIIGQDVQSYLDWITQVDAGSPAGTAGRALDKKTALSLKNDLGLIKIDLDGVLNTAKRIVGQSSNKAEATRKAINDVAGLLQPKQICSSSGTCIYGGPFANLFNSDTNCGPYIYLYSKGTERVRKDNGMVSCLTYVNTQFPNPPEINSEVGQIIDSLVTEATQNINIQLSQVNESNPSLVLAKLDSKSQNRRSAREFLNSSIAYLENLLLDPNSISKKKNQKDLIEKTKVQISNAIKIIDSIDVVENDLDIGKQVDPAIKIAKLSNELIPQGDTFAIPKALSEIINQDIDQKINAGELDANLAALMQLSSNDSLGELIKFYIGLEAAKTQTRSAKELTKSNLISLSGVFSENIEDRMEKLNKESKDDSEAGESLALLCMQTLAVPEAPKIGKFDSTKYCENKVVKAFYDKSGLKMDYSELIKKTYPEKACAVYDFYRKSYLYGLKTNRGNSSGSDKATGAK